MVHQDELVAGGVAVGQRDDADAGGGGGLERGDDVLVLFLDADDAFAGTDELHGHFEAAEEGLGVVVEQLFVLVQEGLALCPVGDGDRNLRPQLHSRGEAAAAGPDDAEFLDSVEGGRAGGAGGSWRILAENARFWCHIPI